MLKQTEFIICKSGSQYSITECGSSGVKRAFMQDGSVTGNGSILLKLSQMKPEDVSIEVFIERNAGSLIFENSSFGESLQASA